MSVTKQSNKSVLMTTRFSLGMLRAVKRYAESLRKKYSGAQITTSSAIRTLLTKALDDIEVLRRYEIGEEIHTAGGAVVKKKVQRKRKVLK